MTNYPTGVQEPPGSAIKLPRKGNKFNAHKMSIDGHQFDSKAEGAYYLHLKNLKLDFKIATEFALMNHSEFILTGRVKEPDVTALFLRRAESELIILHQGLIRGIEKISVKTIKV